MPKRFALKVNGAEHAVEAEPGTPLLYILRNDLKLKGVRAGCAAGHCGACTVLVDGSPAQSCDLPLASAADREVTTIEGLGSAERPHPLQSAFLSEQAAQCGYCINGIVMSAAALLARNPAPSEAEIAAALERHLCRCGTHVRILKAIRGAATAKGTR
jgi:nicotinate dehydrogenase subunit A